MNIVLTHKCNKGCPYCFAHETRTGIKGSSEMSEELFIALLDKAEGSSVSLLGGEPTEHSQFTHFVDILLARKQPFTLISNFLFNDKAILNKVIEAALADKRVGFLINSTDLDKLDRMETFSKNYTALYNALYDVNQEEVITCGITVEEHVPRQTYTAYMDYLNTHLPAIEQFRISLDFPGTEERKEVYTSLHNHDLGDTLIALVQKSISLSATPHIDCIILPCMFKTKEHFKYMVKFTDRTLRTKCGQGAPADVFPDGTSCYCYPLKKTIQVDTGEFETMGDIANDLQVQYAISAAALTLPKPCKGCKFYGKMCDGPPLCYRDLSSLKEVLNG